MDHNNHHHARQAVLDWTRRLGQPIACLQCDRTSALESSKPITRDYLREKWVYACLKLSTLCRHTSLFRCSRVLTMVAPPPVPPRPYSSASYHHDSRPIAPASSPPIPPLPQGFRLYKEDMIRSRSTEPILASRRDVCTTFGFHQYYD